MKKTLKKTFAAAAAAALALCSVVPAFADYVPVTGSNSASFKQYLILDNDAEVPAISFEYSVAPGTAVDAGNGTMAVLAGVGTPSVGIAEFAPEDQTSSETASGVVLGENQKYAVKTVNFNFSGVNFAEPGIYRYIVKMTSAGQQAVSYDIQKGSGAELKTRVLDVYVIDENGTLKVDSMALHETLGSVAATEEGGSGDVAAEHDRLADKSSGFVNSYSTANLEFGKEVTGNQGSKDKYFAFSLNISNAAAETEYKVDLSNADFVSGSSEATAEANRGKTNPVAITTDENGSAAVTFYLCDGQYVKVNGLPQGAGYELTEAAEDYISKAGISAEISRDGEAFADPLNGTVSGEDIRTGFTNTRNGIIPTGLIMDSAPAVMSMVLGMGGLAVYAGGKRSKKNRVEE